LLRNLACGHAVGSSDHQSSEDHEARFMSERAERAYDEV
jgi:hypothetical protein